MAHSDPAAAGPAAAPAPTAGRVRAARWVTEVLAPVPLTLVLIVVVTWRSAPGWQAAVVSGGTAVLFAGVLPAAYVLHGVRGGRWQDHHIPAREHRRVPLTVGLSSVLAGLAVLAAGGAPRDLLALVAAMAAGLVVGLLVTTVWKISIHAAVGAGTVVVLALVVGPGGLLAAPLAAAVAWSRVALGDHTHRQVLAGLTMGAAVAGSVFALLR